MRLAGEAQGSKTNRWYVIKPRPVVADATIETSGTL